MYRKKKLEKTTNKKKEESDKEIKGIKKWPYFKEKKKKKEAKKNIRIRRYRIIKLNYSFSKGV